MIYVLDSCAIIAWINREPGADIVESVIRTALLNPHTPCYMHSLNFCEVFYDAIKRSGETQATNLIADLRALRIIERIDLDSALWMEVGRLKAQYRASLADLCAVVLTKRVAGTLLTSDHHELDALYAARVCPIQFIR